MTYEEVICTALALKVRRYHTYPMLQTQTVGEHSARVALLYCKIWGLPRAEVLLYCLTHDLGEMHAGDNPFQAKRSNPSLKDASNVSERTGLRMLGIHQPELSSEEHRRVKACDLLELYEHCQIELLLGNKIAQTCCDAVRGALISTWGVEETGNLIGVIERGLPR